MWSDSRCRDQLTSSRVLVIDNGAANVKAGFAEEASPSVLLPCTGPTGLTAAQEDMPQLWDNIFFDQLQLDPEGSKVLLTQAAHSPAANRRKALEAMFELYAFAAASFQAQPMLALYAQGCVSGIVIDAGHSMISVVAVVEGVAFPNVTKHLHVAGSQVTQHLLDLLQRKGHALGQAKDLACMNRIKEALCYVAPDSQRELKLARETTFINKSYPLPDGNTVRVAAERFQAAEALFDPSLLDIEGPGIAEAAFDAIQQMDIDNRRCLYEHVVLTGGTTMLPGLPTRLDKEIRRHYLDQILRGDQAGLSRLRLKVSDPPNRRHLAWVGGAVLADLMKDQADFWISKQEYEEDPHRALNKCC